MVGRRAAHRNPYYFKIDPTGQQLPYIDAIDAIILLENSQMITFQAATGQLDFAAFTLKTQDIPLLKLGEVKGVNKVHIWRRLHISSTGETHCAPPRLRSVAPRRPGSCCKPRPTTCGQLERSDRRRIPS